MFTVDKIVIISLPGNIEAKKERWIQSLERIPLKAPLEIVETPREDTVHDTLAALGMELSKSWASLSSEMTAREIGLAIGHWMVWQKIQEEDVETVLILEEDFKPESNHYHVLDTAETWEMIYLGRKSLSVDVTLSGGLVKPGYSHGSFAYLIRKSGIEKLIHSGFHTQVIPVSEALSIMHGSFPSHNLATFFSGRLKALALMKNLIGQYEDQHDLQQDDGAYHPLHPQLFQAFGNATPVWVKKYVNAQLVEKEYDLICDEPIDNVYSFPLFTPLFCKEVIEEAEHYGKWTNYRYKDHPSIDIMLSSFGFNEIYSWVLKEYLYPLLYYKYQLQGDALKKLVSQNFIVRYLAEQQGHLGLHNDGCHISMVVTLNTAFEGGGTFFPKFKKLIRHDQPGYASIHPGFIGYLHGARPIISGKRYILASFFFLEQ